MFLRFTLLFSLFAGYFFKAFLFYLPLNTCDHSRAQQYFVKNAYYLQITQIFG